MVESGSSIAPVLQVVYSSVSAWQCLEHLAQSRLAGELQQPESFQLLAQLPRGLLELLEPMELFERVTLVEQT